MRKMQTHDEQVAYHAKELYREECECILKFMLTGKPALAPTEELMFSWCMEHGYIDYDNEVNKYVITQKGFNHVSM
jgi:hypothetical protein